MRTARLSPNLVGGAIVFEMPHIEDGDLEPIRMLRSTWRSLDRRATYRVGVIDGATRPA